MNCQLCCDTIQSLCGDINVTLAVNWQLCCDTIQSLLCSDINVTLHLNWQLCCDTIQSLCGDINPTLPWICSFAVISCNHCVVILMLLWP